MKILFLDDNEERHKAFRRLSIGNVVDHAYTARQAIVLLNTEHYDLASLDHDLDWQATAGLTPLEETGMDVVSHILKMEKPPTAVNVHSMNVVAAPKMVDALKKDGRTKVSRTPFNVLLRVIR